MVLQGLLSADKEDNMKLKTSELKQIRAGASLSGTLINALVKGFNSFLDAGRYLGSSIRRLRFGIFCPLK